MKKKIEKYLGPESQNARIEITEWGDICHEGCWEIRETNASGVKLKTRYETRKTATFKYVNYSNSGGYFKYQIEKSFVTVDCTVPDAFEQELKKWTQHYEENAERRERHRLDTENFQKNGPRYSDGGGTSIESDGFWNK